MTLSPTAAAAASSLVANDHPFCAVTLIDDTIMGELPQFRITAFVAVVTVPSDDTVIGSEAGTVASMFTAYALQHNTITDSTDTTKACTAP